MKRWIAEQLTGLAGVFGWKLPGWIIRSVPEDERQAMQRQEQALTNALRRGTPRTHAMPAFLEARIERAIIESDKPRQTVPWPSWLALPGTALAAILVIGLFLFNPVQQQQQPVPDSPPVAVVDPTPETLSVDSVMAVVPTIRESALASNLLLRPLAREKARLASDVTGALRLVARSVLPESYIAVVDANLDSLAQEYNGSY